MNQKDGSGNKIRAAFLCTANSCRSQMAEGFARHLGGDVITAYSAGLFSYYIQPKAIDVMKEVGIDISKQRSKAVDDDMLSLMNFVITLCDHAEASCPQIPTHIKRMHWPIQDPVGAMGTEEEIMNNFRRARDEIRVRIEALINDLRMKPRSSSNQT